MDRAQCVSLARIKPGRGLQLAKNAQQIQTRLLRALPTGIVMTVVASDHTPNDWPLQRLVKHYQETKVVVLLLVMTAIVVVLLAVLYANARAVRIQQRQLSEVSGLLQAAPPPSKTIATFNCVLVQDWLHWTRRRALHSHTIC